MAQKWNLQDIRPSGAAAERDARAAQAAPKKRPPAKDIRQRPAKRAPVNDSFDDSDLGSIQIVDGNNRRKKRVIITLVVALVIVVFGIGINMLLGGAEVTINPKVRDISVQANFTAYTVPQVDNLSYELLTLEATGEKQVNASGKEVVSERAQGKVFVYNTSSESPQRLIKNTRFESPDGLIYRIQESIEVPGITTDDKGKTIPGSIAADVFADGTGEQYNIEPTRFTVPGLKDTDQYETIYAESTTAFDGGFEGEKFIIDEAEFSTAKQLLDMELRDKLLGRLDEERPAGFVLYPEAITFIYEELPATTYGESTATIKERAKLVVPIFNETEFAEFLAAQSIPDYRDDGVYLQDPHTLQFSYTDPLQFEKDISTVDEVDFTLNGSAMVIWTLDEDDIKDELVGMKQSLTEEIFRSNPAVSRVRAEIRPFWTSVFPSNPDEIEINTIIEVEE